MINNHVLPRMASSCAILVVALAHCGCASLKSPSEWATAWKAKPTPKNPSDRETINYVGFGKKKDPKAPNSDDLKSKIAVAGKESRDAAFDKYLRQGNLGLTENRLEDAKRDYMRALELRPDHPDCHHRLAVIADKQGMFGQADDHYEAALKLRPRDPNLLSDIGYSYSLRGDDRHAESTLKEALAVSPSHTGAMFNLGAIYAKQGRYEDAVAMFRRGCPEAQAMQNVAKLFPQNPANGANPDFPVARNTPPANTPRQDPSIDLLNMNPEQLKAEMNRRKQEGIDRRRQQQLAELPPRQEWMTDVQQPNQRQIQDPRSGQPIVLGPGGAQNQNQNPNPMNELPTVTPGGGNSGFANNGSFNGNSGQPNAYGQGQPNGQAGNGYPPEQPGSRPNMDVWDGATRDQRIQPAGGQNQDLIGNGSPNASRNVPPATIHYGPPTNRQIPGVNLQPSLPDLSEPQRAPEMRGANMRGTDQSDNLAAAQLGMNVGGLFPSLPPDANSGQGNGQRQPMMETRFGSEFPTPPQFQNPVEQPGRGSFGAGDPRQGNSMNSWGNSNPQPSRSPSRYANFEEGSSITPASPTADWGQNRVTPAGGAAPAANPRFGNEPVERLPNDSHSSWAEKPNMNGTAPFNGPWPANGGNANANGNSPNSIPMWNGGQNSPQPRSAPGQPSDYPEQYPYSRGR